MQRLRRLAMKKTYVKPTLARTALLSHVTALPPLSVVGT
jgi:hypothetical protein